jgi:agmatine deiminase
MNLFSIVCLITVTGAVAVRQPGEFEPQAAVWLSAETNREDFMRVTADLVKALRPHVKIKILLENDVDVKAAKSGLKKHGVNPEQIQYFTDKGATLFLRDATVFTVGRKLGIIDLKWSLYGLAAWCEDVFAKDLETKKEFLSYLDPSDDGLDDFFARATGASVTKSPLSLENATFEVNGKGALLISERLARKRHPSLTRDGIERELLRMPGVKKVIWLYDGAAEDPHMTATIRGNFVGKGAGGHTDEFVRFADPHTILLAYVDHPPKNPVEEVNKERMDRKYRILLNARDQDGKPFRILKVPTPTPITRPVVLAPPSDTKSRWNEVLFPKQEGRMAGDKVFEVAAASYLNFIVSNKVVVVPSFVEDGTPDETQERVRKVIASAFPGRTIRFVNATPFTWSGGGPHCATLNEPLIAGN